MSSLRVYQRKRSSISYTKVKRVIDSLSCLIRTSKNRDFKLKGLRNFRGTDWRITSLNQKSYYCWAKTKLCIEKVRW